MDYEGYEEQSFTVRTWRQSDSEHGDAVWEVWEDQNGNQFRPYDLPSCTIRDQKSGAVISMEWTNEDGKRHRDNGPASIKYGDAPRMMWHQDGKATHIAYPVEIERSPETGEIVRCVFDSNPQPIPNASQTLAVPLGMEP